MIPDQVQAMIAQMRSGLAEKMAAKELHGEAIEIPAPAGPRHALIYRPEGQAGPLPVLFDIHGGGFIYGQPEMDDELCHRFCEELGVVVISPSYRLAPEYRFPADKEDVFGVITQVHDHSEAYGIDPDAMAIVGHSAGGNISTVMAMMGKDKDAFRMRCAVLDYPVLDLNTEAHEKEQPAGCIPPDLAAVFDLCYRDPADGKNVYLSPIFADGEELAGMPPHVIITAEGDSLRGEAEEYAKHLIAAGVETTGRRFMGVGHGFTLEAISEGYGDPAQVEWARETAIQMMIDGIRKYLLD